LRYPNGKSEKERELLAAYLLCPTGKTNQVIMMLRKNAEAELAKRVSLIAEKRCLDI